MFLNCTHFITPNKMKDFNKEIENVSSIYSLPKETLIALRKKTEFKQFKKKEQLIKEGEYQTKFFFLISGIARAYIVDENGKEFTRSIFTAPSSIASLRALIKNTKSTVNFDCLTDCEFFVGNYYDFIELTKTNIDISNVYSRMLEKGFLRAENRVYELSLTAVEKYKLLQEQIPNIDNLIPQYHIASYLGVTNVQLSRIRKKMFE